MATSQTPINPIERGSARGDILALVGVLALVAALFLVPITRDLILTNLGVVFSAIFHTAAVVGGAIGDAAQAVASIFGGVA